MADSSARSPSEGVCCHFCWKTETQAGEVFKFCAQCRRHTYCSRSCQTKHWRLEHKASCKSEAEGRALEKEVLPAKVLEEIDAWFNRNSNLLTAVAVGNLCRALDITSSADCHQELLNQATFRLKVAYCRDGSMKVAYDQSPESLLDKAVNAHIAANSAATLSEEWRMVVALVSVSVQGLAGENAECNIKTRRICMAFKVQDVESFIKKKRFHEILLTLDALMEAE